MARGDEGWEEEKTEREAGGVRGGILGKIGRGGKEGKFPRTIRAPIREGRSETRGGEGRQGVLGGERPTPCPPLANKNQIHQEYSGLRKGIHL